jgi:hypothetical protein
MMTAEFVSQILIPSSVSGECKVFVEIKKLCLPFEGKMIEKEHPITSLFLFALRIDVTDLGPLEKAALLSLQTLPFIPILFLLSKSSIGQTNWKHKPITNRIQTPRPNSRPIFHKFIE